MPDATDALIPSAAAFSRSPRIMMARRTATLFGRSARKARWPGVRDAPLRGWGLDFGNQQRKGGIHAIDAQLSLEVACDQVSKDENSRCHPSGRPHKAASRPLPPIRSL